jgi:hypothetical protein
MAMTARNSARVQPIHFIYFLFRFTAGAGF